MGHAQNVDCHSQGIPLLNSNAYKEANLWSWYIYQRHLTNKHRCCCSRRRCHVGERQRQFTLSKSFKVSSQLCTIAITLAPYPCLLFGSHPPRVNVAKLQCSAQAILACCQRVLERWQVSPQCLVSSIITRRNIFPSCSHSLALAKGLHVSNRHLKGDRQGPQYFFLLGNKQQGEYPKNVMTIPPLVALPMLQLPFPTIIVRPRSLGHREIHVATADLSLSA